jgi:hypothetical protein
MTFYTQKKPLPEDLSKQEKALYQYFIVLQLVDLYNEIPSRSAHGIAITDRARWS